MHSPSEALAIALLPDFGSRSRAAELVPVLPGYVMEADPLYLVYLPSRVTAASVESFVDLAFEMRRDIFPGPQS